YVSQCFWINVPVKQAVFSAFPASCHPVPEASPLISAHAVFAMQIIFFPPFRHHSSKNDSIGPPSRISIGSFSRSYSYGGCFHANESGYSFRIRRIISTPVSNGRNRSRSST